MKVISLNHQINGINALIRQPMREQFYLQAKLRVHTQVHDQVWLLVHNQATRQVYRSIQSGLE